MPSPPHGGSVSSARHPTIEEVLACPSDEEDPFGFAGLGFDAPEKADYIPPIVHAPLDSKDMCGHVASTAGAHGTPREGTVVVRDDVEDGGTSEGALRGR